MIFLIPSTIVSTSLVHCTIPEISTSSCIVPTHGKPHAIASKTARQGCPVSIVDGWIIILCSLRTDLNSCLSMFPVWCISILFFALFKTALKILL